MCCISDGLAYDIPSLKGHLRHCKEHTPHTLETLVVLFTSLAIPDANLNMSLERGPITALDALATPLPGFECSLCHLGFPECHKRLQAIQAHWKQHHADDPSFAAKPWLTSAACLVQKWYGGDNKLRADTGQYVIVCMPSAAPLVLSRQNSEDLKVFHQLVSHAPPAVNLGDVNVLDQRDVSAVVRKMGWQQLATSEGLGDHILLMAQTSSTGLDGSDLDLDLVNRVCTNFIQVVETRLSDLPLTLLARINNPSQYVTCPFLFG
jgi:hypothetical protein